MHVVYDPKGHERDIRVVGSPKGYSRERGVGKERWMVRHGGGKKQLKRWTLESKLVGGKSQQN